MDAETEDSVVQPRWWRRILRGIGYFFLGVFSVYVAALATQICIAIYYIFLESLLGDLFAWLIVFPYVLLLSMAVVILRDSKRRRRYAMFSCGIFVKFTTFIILIGTAPRNPQVFHLVFNTPLGFLAGDLPVFLERMFIDKRRQTQEGELSVDFFNKGAPFREINGQAYSLGPDFADSKLTVIYDPTNGLISGGDIPIEPTR